MIRVSALNLLVCAMVPACIGFGDPGPTRLTPLGQAGGATLVPVATGSLNGLSDMTWGHDEAGHAQLWALPEGMRFLAPLQAAETGRPYLGAGARPIVGIGEAYDTESVTSLGADRFAVGTETFEGGRANDVIFVLAGDGNAAAVPKPLAVEQAIAMPYALWPGFRAAANEGIEGLCHADGSLWASSESVGTTADSRRYAPLGRYDLRSKTWQPMQLLLTLPTGRISALQCRLTPERPDAIELLAIERHFGVGRLLHAWLPRQAGQGAHTPQVVEPTVLAELPQLLQPMINFEGVVWLPSGRVGILTDNHMMCVRGDTYFMTLPAQGLGPKP